MIDPEGAWIFLSHSTKDWNEVRRIRNLLEEKGHRPLVFFLKCLTEHSELDQLIKREIEARTWLLLCDSENARNSSWVREEVAYIKERGDKYHEQIDLNGSIESQIERIDRLCKRATVFVSYSRLDEPQARRIQEALVKSDYRVWMDTDLAGETFADEIATGIDRAVTRGFVLILLSLHSVRSAFTMHEAQYALAKSAKAEHGANILPIMLTDPLATQKAMPSSLRLLLGNIQWFDFSRGNFDMNVARLVAHMKSRPMD